ncbi:unnamed protein product [Vitrella brassicaformis CCMP3155]|uniref:Uncharacterized protein n=2 Tax=Vitrella brassicaformis TaxID=1169539 RepID=A0A0G4FPV5_VITBC|nr:unnamed protein product [Vitrella brassicaformis CCMP3155]|eukprot:CEM16498.1 unnamed protein product [Vitrella brassicaformis CCMP3155]
MSSTSASAAAGGGGYRNESAVNDINRSATQSDGLPLSSGLLAQLSDIKAQLAVAVLDSKCVKKMGISDTIDYLIQKGSVGERRLPMVEAAASEISGALGSLQNGLKRLNGAALLEGHSKNFAFVPPDAKKTTRETTDTHKKDSVADSTPGVPESSSAAAPPFLPGLSLPTDVLRDVFLPLISPHNTIALCRTSETVGSALEAALVDDIDSIIQRDGLRGVIGYAPMRQSTSVRRLVRRLRLIRLHYVMVTGGDWRGNVPVLRMAKSCGRVQQLPIELTGDDLHHVGSKAVIDSRPPSMRQYSLFSHRQWDNRMGLTRDADGRDYLCECMAWWEVTVYTEQTVPDEYRDRFDAADPPCRHGGGEYISFRGLIIEGMAGLSSCHVSHWSWDAPSAEYNRISDLVAQQSPLWGGCRTIDYNIGGPSRRFVILCGDEEGDEFAAYIEMAKWPDGWTDIILYTSDARRQGVSGPAAFPQAVAIAHSKTGDDIALLPMVNEAINTAGGLASR